MALQTRKSAVAVVPEITEGVAVEPTSGDQYLPIQADVDFGSSFDVLDNEELLDSIGRSRPELGAENPTVSFSLYLKGTTSDKPQASEVYKAQFGGEDVETTEYDTVAGSTVDAVNVDAGEGAQYREGQVLLAKHSTGEWEMRPVYSISGDVLTPTFNFMTAPATGTNLGKATTYYPVDDNQQTLSLWNYIANGGAKELVAGGRPVSNAITFTANQYIQQSLSFEGVSYSFNPITVGTDNDLDFTDDDGTHAVSVEAKTYKDPHQLAAALTTAMNSATTQTHLVEYIDKGTDKGKFRISTSTSTVLSLLWNTGTNNATTIGATLGYSVAADDTGTTTYLADAAQDWSSPQTPAFQDRKATVAKDLRVFFGDADDTDCIKASEVTFTIGTPKTNIDDMCEESGRSGSVVNERTIDISVTTLLEKDEADRFRRFRSGDEGRFLLNFGRKTGGNWNEGDAGCVSIPKAQVTEFDINDQSGLVGLSFSLQAFVDSDRDGEAFLSFVQAA